MFKDFAAAVAHVLIAVAVAAILIEMLDFDKYIACGVAATLAYGAGKD